MTENSNKKRALGKGLEQLFSDGALDFDSFESAVVEEGTNNGKVVEIPIKDIRTNPYQPRTNFDPDALEELSESIKEYGVIQPIIVKKSIKGYDLVAGERRTKAAELAGLASIPAIIKEFSDLEMMEIALIENIERENLNPIEEARAYSNIIKINNMTQDEIAKKFAKSRSYITNMLGLLSLPDETIKLVEDRQLSMGHARALSKLDDNDKINELARLIVKNGLSVRDVEKLIASGDLTKKHNVTRMSNDYKYSLYENLVREKLGVKAKIGPKKIEIPFASEDELNDILTKLDIKIDD